MRQFEIGFDEAMDWVVKFHAEIEESFTATLKHLPSFGPDVDPHLHTYLYGLANWPRANDCWNFEGGRYFGSKGREYQRTRMVPLLPKVTKERENELYEGSCFSTSVE